MVFERLFRLDELKSYNLSFSLCESDGFLCLRSDELPCDLSTDGENLFLIIESDSEKDSNWIRGELNDEFRYKTSCIYFNAIGDKVVLYFGMSEEHPSGLLGVIDKGNFDNIIKKPDVTYKDFTDSGFEIKYY